MDDLPSLVELLELAFPDDLADAGGMTLGEIATAVRQWAATNDGELNREQVRALLRALDELETAKAEEWLDQLEPSTLRSPST